MRARCRLTGLKDLAKRKQKEMDAWEDEQNRLYNERQSAANRPSNAPRTNDMRAQGDGSDAAPPGGIGLALPPAHVAPPIVAPSSSAQHDRPSAYGALDDSGRGSRASHVPMLSPPASLASRGDSLHARFRSGDSGAAEDPTFEKYSARGGAPSVMPPRAHSVASVGSHYSSVHGSDGVSYAELERMRREQEILRQQLREQSAMLQKLQGAMDVATRERDDVLKLFNRPSPDMAEYAAPRGLYGAGGGGGSHSTAALGYGHTLQADSRFMPADDATMSSLPASPSHRIAYPMRSAPQIRGPPTPPPRYRAHPGTLDAEFSTATAVGHLQEQSEWIPQGAAVHENLEDTLRVVGSQRPYTAMHEFPALHPPAPRAPCVALLALY